MKTLNVRTLALLGAAGLAMAASTANAGDWNLADGNSTTHFDTTSLAPGSRVGMDNWFVDGVNHMYSQWFWFRTDGMNNEARLNSLPFMAGGTSDTNFNGQQDTLFLRYGAVNTFTIETTFTLSGGTAGSGTADIGELIRITNRSDSVRTFSFFQYCDFDLGNDILDDGVGVINGNAVEQFDTLFGAYVAETIITPTYTFAQVGIYPATLTRLDDGAVDNLSPNALGPILGRGDYTWAFQWDVILNPGQSFLISKDKQITPAPGAIALLGLGGLAAGRRRRTR